MALVADRGFRRNLGTGKSLSFVRPIDEAFHKLTCKKALLDSEHAPIDFWKRAHQAPFS